MRTKLRHMLLAILPLAGLLWTAPVALARDYYPPPYYYRHHHHHHYRHWRRDAYRHPYYYDRGWYRSPDRYGYYRPYPDWYRWHRYYD
ncbi:MAG TPA: hypothetical protein VKK81_26430 [Candidatus Binatia bacterium]|nr:hypothetical protein [Candidatus Binatia bacterium]